MSLPPAGPRGWRGDRPFLALAALVALWIGLALPLLVYPDLNLDYPFVDGDTHDWIANALAFEGKDVRYTGRSPLLPAVAAGLDAVGLSSLLPVLGTGLFAATLLVFYRTAAPLASPAAAFAVALALLCGHAVTGLSRQVMADVPASCLLFFALREGLLAGGDRRRHVSAGALAALSALTQKAALLWPLPVAVTVLAADRAALKSRWLWIGALVFVLPQAGWVALRESLFAPDLAAQWRFLRPHLGGVPFYLAAAATLLGWPALLLLARGLAAAVRGGRDRAWIWIVSLFLTFGGFFVFFYDYNAVRFLVYALWPAALLAARGLASLPRRTAAVASVLLVAVAALPTPDEGQHGTWVPLWPVPAVLAEMRQSIADNGSPRLDPARPAWLAPGVKEVASWSQPARLLAARRLEREERRSAPPRLGPRPWPAESRVLFLYDGLGDGGGRYRVYTRLGNAVMRRVQFVPSAAFLRHRPLLGAEPLGRIDDGLHAWRLRVSGLSETYLLVTARDDSWLASLPSRPAAPAATEAIGRARRIAGLVEPRRYAGVFLAPGEPDAAELYLLLSVDRPDLYVFTETERAGALAALLKAPVLSRRLVDGAEVVETEVLGLPAAWVGFGGLPRPLR